MALAEPGDPDPDAPDLDAGGKLFARPAVFRLGVARLDQLPPADLPEVATAGRQEADGREAGLRRSASAERAMSGIGDQDNFWLNIIEGRSDSR